VHPRLDRTRPSSCSDRDLSIVETLVETQNDHDAMLGLQSIERFSERLPFS
jgi:hypothetical protein